MTFLFSATIPLNSWPHRRVPALASASDTEHETPGMTRVSQMPELAGFESQDGVSENPVSREDGQFDLAFESSITSSLAEITNTSTRGKC